ncbi:MAG: IS3 family transposase [Acidimicrobiales bacterium]
MFPLVQDLADDGVPVSVTCGVLGFSRQAFYKWRNSPVCQRDLDDAYLTNELVDLHAEDPEFGYRFLADELEAAGEAVGERRVWRLCRDQKLWSSTVRKGRSGKRPGPAVHDDLVKRDFTAEAPDLVWLTDITEHPTAEGKLYCCAIKDVFSNRIVGYSIADRMTAQLATGALRSAIARRQPDGTVVVHSDRGSQGELNRSSQHLDDGGERWRRCGSVSGRCSCIGGRCRRRGGRRSLGARTACGSGRRSPVGR